MFKSPDHYPGEKPGTGHCHYPGDCPGELSEHQGNHLGNSGIPVITLVNPLVNKRNYMKSIGNQ